MTHTPLHAAIEADDIEQVQVALANMADMPAALSARDASDHTPLMRAVHRGSLPIVSALLGAGADPNAVATSWYGSPRGVLAMALSAGDPEIVTALLDAGADLHYTRDGFGALLDAVYGRDVLGDARLQSLIQRLIARGARLNDVSPHGESTLRTLSRIGRFDAIAPLLAAGADESLLEWTPLHRAVALGTLEELKDALAKGAAGLEARDVWSRTPFHIALLMADVTRAKLLSSHGADVAATGRCRTPSLFYAIQSRSTDCLRYMLSLGPRLEQVDDFGNTALMEAAERGDSQAVSQLLAAGAQVDFEKVWQRVESADIPPAMAEALTRMRGETALGQTSDPVVARRLLDAGANPKSLSYEARRALVGLPGTPTTRLLDSTPEQYRAGRERRFGTANPEKIDNPYWLAMIRAGIDAYGADEHYAPDSADRSTPGWCARRFGQSLTFLPDGRIIQVGGEHEDSYDPDFCIYNDVFVHAPDGTIAIYGYPQETFPPTDFHTATLIDETLWLIGCLGYVDARQPSVTPVYALNTRTMRIESIATTGRAPGWIHRHSAVRRGDSEIVISGGLCATEMDGGVKPVEEVFVLDVRERVWR